MIDTVCLEEGERLVSDGQATRVSPRKASLTLQDAQVLATLRPRKVVGLRTEDLREMPAHRVEILQRLSGWGLLPKSETLERFEPEQR